MNDGDWICVDANCGNINFSRRLVCYRCNKERPESTKQSKKKLGTEIGKCAAEKSRGLFNPDDWQCNKCANVNWARRVTCNVCNAPKFGDVEARTGYGGGYNERGVVEYRKREPSSEDEFDEFGRRKKKRRMDDSPEEKPSTSQGGDLVEEDDEESGDEADLSKYDLWGSEDEQGSSSKPDKTEATKEKGDLPEVVTTNLDQNGISNSPDKKSKSRSRSSSSSSSTSSSSSSSQSSANAPKNKFDDFNLNSERECSPKGSRPSKSPRSRSISRRRSGDSRESRDSRNRDSKSREDRSRDRDRRDKSRSDRRDKHSSHHNRPRHR